MTTASNLLAGAVLRPLRVIVAREPARIQHRGGRVSWGIARTPYGSSPPSTPHHITPHHTKSCHTTPHNALPMGAAPRPRWPTRRRRARRTRQTFARKGEEERRRETKECKGSGQERESESPRGCTRCPQSENARVAREEGRAHRPRGALMPREPPFSLRRARGVVADWRDR